MFIFVFSSGRINNNFHQPPDVALSYSISGLLNIMYAFERFISLPHLYLIRSIMWMSGVGTLCAHAHYRASLLIIDARNNLS